MTRPILEIAQLSKQYRLGQIGTGTLSHDLNRFWHRLRGKEDPYLKIGETNDRSRRGSSPFVWALQDINFQVQPGEVVGIIGKNGAGKSTLLKILSRITAPTTGEVRAYGRIASLLEVGTGFHSELTGRENIYLNGAILGMSRQEITAKLDEIIAFSGCERYIDTPVKRYSSGMTVRLAFAVAAHLEPEILVVDEVLAVGDAEFQKKAIGKMQDISRGGQRTVLFVSHNMAAVKSLCQRGIVLEHGKMVFDGSSEEAVSYYQKSSDTKRNYVANTDHKELFLKSAMLMHETNNLASGEDVIIKFETQTRLTSLQTKYLLVRVMDQLEQAVFSCEIEIVAEKNEYVLTIPGNTLVKGNYKLNCIIYHPAVMQHDIVEECCSFTVVDNIQAFAHLETFDIGKVYVPHSWK